MHGAFTKSGCFDRQLEAMWERLYRVCYSWCHDAQLAADLVQETIESALRNKKKIPDESSLTRWLFKVMVNKWRDHCRLKKPQTDIEHVTIISDTTPDADHEYEETVMHIYLAMSKLNSNQREVLSLVALDGLSYEAVANILELPIGTVMSRLCRARQNLREILRRPPEADDKSGPTIRRVK